MDIEQLTIRVRALREQYHELELKHHGSKWSVEEDALAFLTDAALVGRLAMAQQGRWPKGADSAKALKHKLGESVWWLMVLADRMDIDFGEAVNGFITETEKILQP